MLHTALFVALIIAICLVLLGVKIILGKGEFVNTHVDGNKALADKGISCAKSQDKFMQGRETFVIKEHS